MPDQSFTFDSVSRRFRALDSGRFISEREVRDAVDRTADLASRQMGEAAARFRTGQIGAAEWIAQSQQIVKDSQIASALAAYGGRLRMDQGKWGLVGQQIRVQYAYLNRMADDMLSGRQRMNGRLDARARQYGQASRSLYENIRRRESAAAGLSFERNILHPADHCAQCVSQSARGLVPLGSLVPIGQRTCRSQCRCTLSFSRSAVEAA